MSNIQQAEIVKKALELQIDAEQKGHRLEQLRYEQFDPRPEPPAEEPYPKIESPVKFNYLMAFGGLVGCFVLSACISSYSSAIMLLLFFVGIAFPFVYYSAYYKKQKEQAITEIQNSPEYQKQCQEVDQRNKQATDHYNNVTLPEYNKKLDEWKAEHSARLKEAEKDYDEACVKLDDHYLSTRIIPKQYQNIHALTYISDFMSTSEYMIKDAIDAYEREATRIREEQANAIEAAKVDAMAESNAIAERARRDQWKQEAIRTVQRHNTNKHLKNIGKR